MKDIYPDAELKLLDPSIPSITASGQVCLLTRPTSPCTASAGLQDIAVYSPKAIAGYWEAE